MVESKNQAEIDCFRIGDRMLQHRRLLPTLLAVAENTSHHEPTPRREAARGSRA